MKTGGFFNQQFTVARVYGIPVRLDYRWFVVVALSVWLIAARMSGGEMLIVTLRVPPVGIATAWTLGVVTTLALFLCVLGHELSHALMARAEGIEIEEIVLHPFGGLARLRNQPDTPGAEFRIALAGPAASFLFAVLGLAGAKVAALGNYRATVAVFFFIGAGNLLLAVFNLFPGYPLDGGRVLRALLWHKSGDMADATRKAGICGVLIAAILIIFGIYMIFAPNFRAYSMGLWTVLVGLFLLDAARNVVRAAPYLTPATVGEAMSAPITIEPDVLVSRFVDEVLPRYRQTSFPVAHGKQLHGILALEDLKALPRERWRQTRLRDVMRPIDAQLFVQPSTAMAQAETQMQRNGTNSVAVVDNRGELVGFLLRRPQSIKRRDNS
ncbi:MAG: site-2 protease family protein [Pyrinomonadaceae bacterium]